MNNSNDKSDNGNKIIYIYIRNANFRILNCDS